MSEELSLFCFGYLMNLMFLSSTSFWDYMTLSGSLSVHLNKFLLSLPFLSFSDIPVVYTNDLYLIPFFVLP